MQFHVQYIWKIITLYYQLNRAGSDLIIMSSVVK